MALLECRFNQLFSHYERIVDPNLGGVDLSGIEYEQEIIEQCLKCPGLVRVYSVLEDDPQIKFEPPMECSDNLLSTGDTSEVENPW